MRHEDGEMEGSYRVPTPFFNFGDKPKIQR